MQYKGIASNSVKVMEEHLFLLLTVEKIKPLIIGKFENPRCFKLINKANLACYYRLNNKASSPTDH